MKVRFHPAARAEVRKYRRWYFERSEAAEAGFVAELDHAIARIIESPLAYPLTTRGRRRFVLFKYPFDVVYNVHLADIEIIAVAHHSRKPTDWRNR